MANKHERPVKPETIDRRDQKAQKKLPQRPLKPQNCTDSTRWE